MRKMKHADNQINLDPFLFPMSYCLRLATLSKPVSLMLCGLALGQGTTLRSHVWMPLSGPGEWEMPVMKVGSVSGCKNTLDYCTGNSCKNTLDYCTGNRWKRFLIGKLVSEMLVCIMPTSWWFMYVSFSYAHVGMYPWFALMLPVWRSMHYILNCSSYLKYSHRVSSGSTSGQQYLLEIVLRNYWVRDSTSLDTSTRLK